MLHTTSQNVTDPFFRDWYHATATYETEGGPLFMRCLQQRASSRTASNAILSTVAGVNLDVSDSTVVTGEISVHWTTTFRLRQNESGLGGERVSRPSMEKCPRIQYHDAFPILNSQSTLVQGA